MRAIQIVEPRKIAMLDDTPEPEPVEGEVLVRCSHVALCGSNMGQYTGEGLWGDIDFPNPVGWAGHENIGTIVASRCEDWREGTLVLAQPHGYYGFAEYIVSRPPAIARLPQDAPDPAALVVAQPLATVLRALTRTDDIIGKSCAVVGQGPMGLIFTHVLRMMGASMVIATDVLDWRLEWSKRYGADHIIDASKQDVVKVVTELTNKEMLDFVVEAVGYVDSLKTAAYLPKYEGRLYVFGMPHYELQEFPWYHVFRQNIQINTCVGPECGPFFQTAVDMVLDDRASALTEMVTPRMPWDKAPEAFEMYAECAKDSLKLTLEV
ncbi:MAG: zinc-dependent alcohol dehydrogenase [Planctomycetota bacterium]|jgi:threonine dehydrogenase-like Zn-dependent dehydrogenase